MPADDPATTPVDPSTPAPRARAKSTAAKTVKATKTAKAAKPATRKAAPKKAAGKSASAKAAVRPRRAVANDVYDEESPAPARGGRRAGAQLLIVESPTKIKTIKKFLGPEFILKASRGHIRDIPSKGRGKDAFGIDFDHGYKPVYEVIAGRESTLRDLQAAAAKARHVWLAPDPDREGEAIAWHLKEALRLPDAKTSRVTFNAITRAAVQEAMQHPSRINMDLVDAQQGRRVLDRLVGFSLSPFLWKKVTKGLSAGRVQSVALRIVVEREREIKAFKAEEFWRVTASLATGAVGAGAGAPTPFQAELTAWKGEKFALGAPAASTGDAVKAVVAALEKADYRVREVVEREVRRKALPPFITSTLQQAANTFLGYGAQKTMRIAQQLYEGVELADRQSTGLITYMRTDSTRLAPESLADARDFIGKNFAPAYLPDKAQFYSSRAGAQDAHEAIHPTSAELTPDKVRPYLTFEQFRLYELIWKRFIACQMTPAIYQTTTAVIDAGDGVFEAKGRRVVFDGHTVMALGGPRRGKKKDDKESADGESKPSESAADEADENPEDQWLPKLTAGDLLRLLGLDPKQHFTQPPPRYSEASLVRTLEKEGIGRPSTYASIVQTIQDRGYVRQENRRFFATELGMAVTDILRDNFPDVMDLKFTAQMESQLDGVEDGKVNWSRLIDDFYQPFSKRLAEATKDAGALHGGPAPNGEVCPVCGGAMTVRYSRRGAFLGCVNYPDCKGTRPLEGEGLPGENGNDADLGEPPPCPECAAPMLRKRSRFGWFLACSKYPDCKKTLPLDREGRLPQLPDVTRVCEKCGRTMRARLGSRGPFLACEGYPECRNTKHLTKSGEVVDLPDAGGAKCDQCGADMVVRMSRRGPFLACSAYPKCKNAKPLPKKDNGE